MSKYPKYACTENRVEKALGARYNAHVAQASEKNPPL